MLSQMYKDNRQFQSSRLTFVKGAAGLGCDYQHHLVLVRDVYSPATPAVTLASGFVRLTVQPPLN